MTDGKLRILKTFPNYSSATASQQGLQYNPILAFLDQFEDSAVLAGAAHRAILDRDLDVMSRLHQKGRLHLGLHAHAVNEVLERAAEPGAPQAHAAIRPVLDRHVGGRARPGLGGREKHHRLVEVDSRPPRL